MVALRNPLSVLRSRLLYTGYRENDVSDIVLDNKVVVNVSMASRGGVTHIIDQQLLAQYVLQPRPVEPPLADIYLCLNERTNQARFASLAQQLRDAFGDAEIAELPSESENVNSRSSQRRIITRGMPLRDYVRADDWRVWNATCGASPVDK